MLSQKLTPLGGQGGRQEKQLYKTETKRFIYETSMNNVVRQS